MDLPPAGDAGPNLVARPEQLDVRGDLLDGERTRADQAHVAEEHVEQLRKLVDAPPPKPRPDLRQTEGRS